MSMSQIHSVDQMLETHGLKKTSLRRSLLGELLSVSEPLSQANLIQRLEDRQQAVDRVSIYRNLLQLKDCGLVHEVETNKYIACAHKCHQHPHVVLFCQNCEKHSELKDHPRIDGLMNALLRFRFFGPSQPLMVRGICESCSLPNKRTKTHADE